MTSTTPAVPAELDPDAASALVHSGGAVLIDVREPHEWTAGHAPQARHLPLGQLDPRLLDDTSTYVLVCRSGRRSATGAQALLAAGRTAYNLTGGMQAWQLAGLDVRDDAGQPGVVR